MFYPFVAAWFAKSRQISELDLSFIKKVYIAAWVLDPTTADLLHQKLPNAKIVQMYGMTEVVAISASDLIDDREEAEIKPLTVIENQGELCVSSGQLLPFIKAKIIDLNNGEALPKGERGEILISTPSMMKGYLINGEEHRKEGEWLQTGDLGFFDDDENIYVLERLSFMFKYLSLFVSPSEIESVLSEHSGIQSVGVTGVPDLEVTTLATAFVVLKPRTQLTEDEICAFVADKLPEYKHLHGGVRFVEKLPVNKGGKLDRVKLRDMALSGE
ncbi:luciferin 4-monooxygenase-like [Neocloeon triangulifer]|uniref:luciferin 4-monooxygenase-like n=1 Tax=Neocloeon triangulifer TaxID=2078957 RepID=UPI00286F794A|nr:luciferin 4-monooxygenase-like [Neocloeon triangulifer]